MNPQIQQLKEKADHTKQLYMAGGATYEEMRAACKAYVDAANARIKELAREHGMKPRFISVNGYMR